MIWARITIDVSPRGEVQAWSVSVHNGDDLIDVYVVPVSPFDDPVEVLASAVEYIASEIGEQQSLF